MLSNLSEKGDSQVPTDRSWGGRRVPGSMKTWLEQVLVSDQQTWAHRAGPHDSLVSIPFLCLIVMYFVTL